MIKRAPSNRIQELRLEKKWNQRELADQVGAHWVTISKLERGQMNLTQDWMNRLAAALNVEATELIADYPQDRSVYVQGYIGKEGYIFGDEDEEGYDGVEFHIDIGTHLPNISIWHFANDNIFSIIRGGDLLRFTHFQGQDPERYLGRLCILEFEQPHTPMAGVLSETDKSVGNGVFDLILPNGKRLSGFQPKRVSVLTMVVPSPDFKVDDFGMP